MPRPPQSEARGRPSPAKRPTRAATTPAAEVDAQLDAPSTLKTMAETAVDVPATTEQTEVAQELDAGKDEEEMHAAEHQQADDPSVASSGEVPLTSVAPAVTAGTPRMEMTELVTVDAEVNDAGVVIVLNISDLVVGA